MAYQTTCSLCGGQLYMLQATIIFDRHRVPLTPDGYGIGDPDTLDRISNAENEIAICKDCSSEFDINVDIEWYEVDDEIELSLS